MNVDRRGLFTLAGALAIAPILKYLPHRYQDVPDFHAHEVLTSSDLNKMSEAIRELQRRVK